MVKKRVQMWVDPAFKKMCKKTAAVKGTTIEDVTKKAAEMEDPADFFEKDEKKKSWKFRI